MPNLPAHIQLAKSAASRLKHPDIESNIGYFCIGATAPDIRALTKRARSEYHFVDLDFETVGTGVRTMFAAYPELMNAAEHDGPTRAFMAGYITHLLADESYIVQMFRPYFGADGVFEDSELAKVLDRALQLDFDRRVWDDVKGAIAQAEVELGNVNVRFLPTDDLLQWNEWVHRVVDGGFSWERLRFMARRIAAGDEQHPAFGHAEAFLDSVDGWLATLYESVPRSRVEEFTADAIDTLTDGLRTYLS